MAEIKITIKDKPLGQEGDVEIRATPSFEQMAKMINSGHNISAAEGYALAMLNFARRLSKQSQPATSIPRIA